VYKRQASKRDFVLVYDDTTLVKPDRYADVKLLVEYAASDDPTAMLQTGHGPLNYFPTHNFLLTVDSSKLKNESWIPPFYRDSVKSGISWTYSDYGLQKNALILLDMLAHNNWQRPVYFATTTGDDAYISLFDYLQLEGLAYRLVPYRVNKTDEQVGGVNSDVMYDNIMNKFAWGQMNNPRVYLDETNMRMTVVFRSVFARLAKALVAEEKIDKAVKVCDKCIEVMPDNCVPFNYQMLPFINIYYKAGQTEVAEKIAYRIKEYADQKLGYYSQFSGGQAAYLNIEKRSSLEVLVKLYAIAKTYKRTLFAKEILRIYDKFESKPMPDPFLKENIEK
jgi:tetratricopeptide (TPR) repeat protein